LVYEILIECDELRLYKNIMNEDMSDCYVLGISC